MEIESDQNMSRPRRKRTKTECQWSRVISLVKSGCTPPEAVRKSGINRRSYESRLYRMRSQIQLLSNNQMGSEAPR